MARLFRREDQRRHELLSAYVDGEVTAEEAREVEEMLASSEDARRELAELQATVDLIRGLPELEPPRSFALDQVPKPRWTLWWPSVRATGLATSVATMLLVGLVAGDMLNVLEQARFGGDDSEYASDDSALAAASVPEPVQESMTGVAMDAPATAIPEAQLMKGLAGQDESPQEHAAPAAAALRTAKVESSDEPVAAMQQDTVAESTQAEQAESSEEPQFAVQSVMSTDTPQADDEGESNVEPVAAIQQASTEGGHPIEGYDPSDEFYEIDEPEPDGFTVPLVELQVVTAIVVVVLVGATLVAILRRKRSVL